MPEAITEMVQALERTADEAEKQRRAKVKAQRALDREIDTLTETISSAEAEVRGIVRATE